MVLSDEMSDGQHAYIMRLLDRRHISGRVAHKLISLLEDQPEKNSDELDNLKSALERPNT